MFSWFYYFGVCGELEYCECVWWNKDVCFMGVVKGGWEGGREGWRGKEGRRERRWDIRF